MSASIPTRLASAVRWAFWRAALGIASPGFEVIGERPQRPSVIIANHNSHADTPALIAALGYKSCPRVVAAYDYWYTRWTRRWFCKLIVSGFPIHRDGGGYEQLLGARTLFEAGHSLVIFPEGTRSRDGSLGRFHSGPFRLAQDLGLPVVPVVLSGTAAMLSPGSKFHRTKITVVIGKPVTGLDAESAHATMTETINRSGV